MAQTATVVIEIYCTNRPLGNLNKSVTMVSILLLVFQDLFHQSLLHFWYQLVLSFFFSVIIYLIQFFIPFLCALKIKYSFQLHVTQVTSLGWNSELLF